MTANRSFKQRVRARMDSTGEKYTEARRAILALDCEERGYHVFDSSFTDPSDGPDVCACGYRKGSR